MEITEVSVIKKDGTRQPFDPEKIIIAVSKSANRAMSPLTDDDKEKIVSYVEDYIQNYQREEITVPQMHNLVESALEFFKPEVAKSYRDYRNYKTEFVEMLNSIYKKAQSIMYIGDKENSNTDSALVSTKRSLIYNQLNKELYQKFFMSVEELQACREGYIYVHDMSARRDTLNCFKRNTNFITSTGVKSFNDFKDSDEVEVLTHKGRLRKGIVHSYGRQKLQQVVFKNDISGANKSVFVTKNHRWILRDGTETTEIKIGDELFSLGKTSGEWRVECIFYSEFNEVVWCIEVEDDHSFVLDGGIPTGNCCLSDVKSILEGGFEMGNLPYNEPKTLDVVFDVIGDIVLSAASQQYGGFTIPRVDEILSKYAEASYLMYKEKKFNDLMKEYQDMKSIATFSVSDSCLEERSIEIAEQYAIEKVTRDMEQGFQGWECKFNTVSSSRGDYPFTTITIGLGRDKFAKLATKTCLRVRAAGQGKDGKKRVVLFPKIVFTYTNDLHGEGKELEDLFKEAIKCSSKAMYPDYLSLDGDTTVAEMYHKYGEVIAPMGCRAFLSPYYERGGFYPEDENDRPVFTGRWNGGVVSLHLPMILAKSRKEGKDFYEVLDYYLELIRNIHKRTRDYLGEMKASVNPLQFCEGGFYRGHLKPTDKIKPLLDYVTFSYGITALNELNRLYNGKSIREDGEFPLEVMEYINKKLEQFKKEDHILYAVYSTPAESLCTEGNTLVQTVDGYKKIKDITTDDLVYTYNETEKKVELKRVLRAGKSKKDAKVVKVTTTNGQTFICTPDHPFGVRTMITNPKTGKFLKETVKYIKAKDLKKGYRLKSNYIRLNYFGRPECSIYHNGRRQLIHDINAEYAYGKKPEGHVVHHKDGDVTNNKFENLQYIAADEHRRLHMKDTISKYSYTLESQSGEKNSFYGKHHTDETKKKLRLKKMGKSIEVFDLSEKHVGHFDCATDAKRAGLTVNLVVKACKGLRKTILGAHFYKDHYWYYTDDCSHMLVEENHKVKSVEYLDETYDVYNMTVEDNANYFIGGDQGILVHNCGTQVKQFRKMYGIIENVSDREYVSNSFHCHVSEDMDPIEKQDKEHRFWNLTQGGRIQYVKYPIDYNYEAMATLVRRAMDMGLYEGLNMSLSYCDDCGHAELEMDECPVCNCKNIIRIERMNG